MQKSVLNLSSCFLFVCVGVWWEVREVGVHVEVSYVVVVKSRVVCTHRVYRDRVRGVWTWV